MCSESETLSFNVLNERTVLKRTVGGGFSISWVHICDERNLWKLWKLFDTEVLLSDASGSGGPSIVSTLILSK